MIFGYYLLISFDFVLCVVDEPCLLFIRAQSTLRLCDVRYPSYTRYLEHIFPSFSLSLLSLIGVCRFFNCPPYSPCRSLINHYRPLTLLVLTCSSYLFLFFSLFFLVLVSRMSHITLSCSFGSYTPSSLAICYTFFLRPMHLPVQIPTFMRFLYIQVCSYLSHPPSLPCLTFPPAPTLFSRLYSKALWACVVHM